MPETDLRVAAPALAAGAAARRSGSGRRSWLLYLGPAVLVSAVLFLYPAVDTVRQSFYESDGITDPTFVGTANYARLMGDSAFHTALVNTLAFTGIYVTGSMVVGVSFALALHAKIPGHGLWRFMILLPVFLPFAYLGLVWQIGLDPTVGWVTALLERISPDLAQPYLTDRNLAVPTLAVISVLQGAGWPMAIVWTALQDVEPEVIEAAVVDGASAWQRARFVLVPAVAPVIGTVAILQIIFSLKVFDIIWVMTKGGPAGATNSLTTYVYQIAFQNRDFGGGAAAAVIATVLVAALVFANEVRVRRQEAKNA